MILLWCDICPIPDEMAEWVEGPSPVLGEDQGIQTHGFKPWSGQTNCLKIDTCRFLDRHSALLGYGKDWVAQCQDNVTEWGYQVMVLAVWSSSVAAL